MRVCGVWWWRFGDPEKDLIFDCGFRALGVPLVIGSARNCMIERHELEAQATFEASRLCSID